MFHAQYFSEDIMATGSTEYTGNGDTQAMLNSFWERTLNDIRRLTPVSEI